MVTGKSSLNGDLFVNNVQTNRINMRDGKRGARKGRERVLVENEDDIIARNMMVCESSICFIERNVKKEEGEKMRNPKRKVKRKAPIRILRMRMNLKKNLL